MKTSTLLAPLLTAFLLVSCLAAHNAGYPSKVKFAKEGGTIYCSGTESFYSIDITDYDGNGRTNESGIPDSITVTYEWLTVKGKGDYTKMELTATPNNTGKKRTLYVSAMIDDTFAEIKVVQEK